MTDADAPAPGDSFDLEAADASEAAADHVAAEGAEAPESEEPFWMRALRSTSPDPPIEQVGSFDDLKLNYQNYGVRGLQKMGGVDDSEAWVDLVKFAIGFILEQGGAAADGGDDDELPDAGPDVGLEGL